MAVDTVGERQRVLGYGVPLGNFPTPDGDIDSGDRVYMWGGYFTGYPPTDIYIPDHVARAKSLLIEQLKPRPKINALVEAFVSPAQELENMLSDLLRFRSIDTAVGAQLDIIGEIVGQERGGRTDAEYRAAIRARIQINNSSGTPEDVSTGLSFLTNATQVRLLERFPGAITLYTNGSTVPQDLTEQMNAIRAVGVRITGISYDLGDTPFEFSGEGGIPYGEGDGFSETNYTEGGLPIGGVLCELAT